jgi:hypothetical protein
MEIKAKRVKYSAEQYFDLNTERKRLLGRLINRWEDTMETVCGRVDRISLTKDRLQ